MLLIVAIAAVVVSLLLLGLAIPSGSRDPHRRGAAGLYSVDRRSGAGNDGAGRGGEGCSMGVMHVFDGAPHEYSVHSHDTGGHGADLSGCESGGSDGGGCDGDGGSD